VVVDWSYSRIAKPLRFVFCAVAWRGEEKEDSSHYGPLTHINRCRLQPLRSLLTTCPPSSSSFWQPSSTLRQQASP